jgi:hypothetical protein
MTHAHLIRWSGTLSMAAAILIVASQLAVYTIDTSDVAAAITTVPAHLYNLFKLVGFVLLLLGLVGLYARQSVESGVLGLVAFLTAFLGTTLVAGDWWFEGFVVPWLVAIAPDVVVGEPSGILAIGGTVGFSLFALGWALFGVATLRARVFPRWTGIVVIIGGVLGYGAGSPPLLMGLAIGVGSMGFLLARTRPHGEDGVERQAEDEVAA